METGAKGDHCVAASFPYLSNVSGSTVIFGVLLA